MGSRVLVFVRKQLYFIKGVYMCYEVRLLCCHYRDADTQTKRESSTNVPKPSTFVAGLRGCNSTKTTMNVVDLTVDVD